MSHYDIVCATTTTTNAHFKHKSAWRTTLILLTECSAQIGHSPLVGCVDMQEEIALYVYMTMLNCPYARLCQQTATTT